MKGEKVKKWLEHHWEGIPIIIALILLAVFVFIDPVQFQNVAWYGLVALTAVYAWATMRIASENRRTVEEMRQSRLDAVKPALSLQPGDWAIGGGFGALYLVNSGGVARDVKIDIEIAKSESTRSLFAPAIERECWVYLGPLEKAQHQTEAITVRLRFRDGYNQHHDDLLSIDLADLRTEGREIVGRYSELVQIKQTLASLVAEVRHRNR